MIYSVQVPKDFIKKGNNLSVNALKLLYYFIGKAQVKSLGIKRDSKAMDSISEVFEEEIKVIVTIEELKDIFPVVKINAKRLEKAYLELINGEYKKLFLKPMLYRDCIEFTLANDFIELLEEVDEVKSNNVINLIELFTFKNKYSINLYLYCLTLYRGSCGNIQISIDNLKNILCPRGTSQEDKMFIQRFIKKPSQEIILNTNLNIQYKREKNNIRFTVYKNN